MTITMTFTEKLGRPKVYLANSMSSLLTSDIRYSGLCYKLFIELLYKSGL